VQYRDPMPAKRTPRGPRTHDGSSPLRIIYVAEDEWHVYEQPSSYDRRNSPDLVFESASVIRRVRNYPDNWADLSDEELLAISWNR